MKTEIKTSHGTFVAVFSQRGLVSLSFPRGGKPRSCESASKPSPGWVAVTDRALRQALSGQTPSALPPMDLSGGTEFQRAVWSALRKIQPGKTRSYSELAASIGKPNAARAVGSACGKNPIPVLIPCHRVLAANKKLGGFSGGLEWKRRLLAVESKGF